MGNEIKEIRKRIGVKKREMCDFMGMTYAGYFRLEEREVPEKKNVLAARHVETQWERGELSVVEKPEKDDLI